MQCDSATTLNDRTHASRARYVLFLSLDVAGVSGFQIWVACGLTLSVWHEIIQANQSTGPWSLSLEGRTPDSRAPFGGYAPTFRGLIWGWGGRIYPRWGGDLSLEGGRFSVALILLRKLWISNSNCNRVTKAIAFISSSAIRTNITMINILSLMRNVYSSEQIMLAI